MRRRSIRARVLLAVGTTIVALVVAEAALRARGRVQQPSVTLSREILIGCFDPVLGWTNRPGLDRFNVKEVAPDGRPVLDYVVSTNSAGLRGARDYAVPRPPGVRRVVCAGDSFTFGMGVNTEAAFPALLEARGVETPNLGVMGYGVAQCLLRLERDGLPLAPDAVLLSVIDDDLSRDWEDWSPNGHARPRYTLDGEVLVAPRVPLRPPMPPGSPRARQPSSGSELLDLARLGLGNLRSRAGGLPPWLGRGRWELCRALVAEVHAACSRAGAELIVVYLPVLSGGEAEPPPLPRLLTELGRERGFRVVDLTARFVEADARAPGSLYLAGDGHPSVAGHALIAEHVARELPHLFGH